MPESRKRPGHHEFKKKSAIPAKQRVRGRVVLAVLFGAFGLLVALFNTGNYAVWIIVALIAATLGYYVGKNMEKDAGKKSNSK